MDFAFIIRQTESFCPFCVFKRTPACPVVCHGHDNNTIRGNKTLASNSDLFETIKGYTWARIYIRFEKHALYFQSKIDYAVNQF